MKLLDTLFKNIKKEQNTINDTFGLDISSGSIKALKLETKPTDNTLIVKEAHYTKLHDSIIKMGMVKDKTRVKIILRDFFLNKNFGKIAVLNVPEVQSFATTFKIEDTIETSKIKDIILHEAQKEIPFPLKETYYDFKILNRQENKQNVLFVASPKVVLNDYISILKDVSIKTEVFELEPLSSFRAIKKGIKKLKNNVLIINVGFALTNINIFENNSLQIIAYLPYGSEHIDEFISHDLKISNTQANVLRKTDGFKSKNQKFKEVLTKEVLKHIIANIKKLIYFYQYNKNLTSGFEKIVLVGGFSVTPGFDKFIENEFKKETLIFDPLAINKIELPEQFSYLKDKKVSFTQAIGLALRGLKKNCVSCDLNLLKRAVL